MGRKSGSYKFEKRQKELKKLKKKQAKLERRQNKGPDLQEEPSPPPVGTFGLPEEPDTDGPLD